MKAAAGTPTGSAAGSRDRRLEARDRVVGEGTDRAAGEPGHPFDGQDPTPRHEPAERGQRVRGRLDDGRQVGGVDGHRDRPRLDRGHPVADLEEATRTHADEAVPAEPLAALDGLQEIRRAAVVEAQERADRRLEVGVAGRSQEDRVGVADEALGFGQTERIGGAHGFDASGRCTAVSGGIRPDGHEKRPSSPGTKGRAFRGATLIRRVPHSRDRRVGRGLSPVAADRRCPISLALCAGAYWASVGPPVAVRSGGSRVHPPPSSPRFPPATGSLCRRATGTRPDQRPFFVM